ncbi:Wzz/FepE/Etk N-terminal domain-containing protein [Flavobacterium sp. B183]|uniref:Wzz/FepE/Etk N-terminal domain-containing protein n=1 Tax=Flavobacterium sp. B183 TaxID=907046 RepID=UPI00201F221F|nr:Wzz/FepE/Etk N-terminal domain-containing protein [Flavobacterium sp. B183]URC13118.1 Wzz/FepE/Etk N-terminal domain-containing protein [Flavobacterium sp. B183]
MENSVANDEISLKELIEKIKVLFHVLILKWRIIIFWGVIGAGTGVIYSFVEKPIYTATLTFALEDEKQGGGLGALGIASSLGLDMGGGGGSLFTGTNLTELFKSRIMVEKALLSSVQLNKQTFSLAEMYIQNKQWRKKWDDNSKLKYIQFAPESNRKNFTRVQDSIFGVIYDDLTKNYLSVQQKDKKSAIISMDVKSNNELFSLYLCEALAKEVGKFYVETKSRKARINMDILERQTDSVRAELNSAITGVAVANDNTFNLNPALNVRRTPSAKRQVDVQANTAILTELVKQSEMAKVTLRKETPLIQMIDRPILPLHKEKIGKTKAFVLGLFIASFLCILFLSIQHFIKKLA